ncbi:hydroxylamine reductase [Methanohalophilus levihalophilus]|uniref:hydroxylamine reductase n=1 Tax=Methanohalophilus levihalophilus TaxID=1431282 RepID=UPI001AEB5C96|nr:hydroxylamine reductase [Methanohalophilus levihalophilus]MBP2031019.1 hydroxylamine reductase [Methanohalophilus levihalophilus]
MFCYQCEEAAKGTGCTTGGACGKSGEVADLQDKLIYALKGVAFYNSKAREEGFAKPETDKLLLEGLFATVTNVNFEADYFENKIAEAVAVRDGLRDELSEKGIKKLLSKLSGKVTVENAPGEATVSREPLMAGDNFGILRIEDEDIRSLKELLVYGIKGMAAYAHHAYVLGFQDEEIFKFIEKGLVATTRDDIGVPELVDLVLECGSVAVTTMALLDEANTSTYGTPEPTSINIGVGENPGILVSGHDLKDIKQLLEQTEGTGIDVYTHGEMLPAHAYPELKKYEHLVGNYGGSWWAQKDEFESFNGPILMTTNCLVPPKASYKDRLYTTSMVGFEGVKHIEENADGSKDFSAIIKQAKQCSAPDELETGAVMGGFAHSAVLSVADKVIEAVKAGKISRFIVMAGCDGRHSSRDYYSDFANSLPDDAVILTAGCAKYRYNKLDLGDIGGIPRVLDAGQCNDSYSLVVVALKLAEAFGLDDVNELPVSYNIAWYEQKACTVLLALLSLGVKNIVLGPELPAFVSPNVLNVLVENFNISANTTVEADLERLL